MALLGCHLDGPCRESGDGLLIVCFHHRFKLYASFYEVGGNATKLVIGLTTSELMRTSKRW